MHRAAVFCLLMALAANCEKAKEEPLSIRNTMDKINESWQNVTSVFEDILGIDIPSTQAELKSAIQENLNKLKQNAETFQKKLDEYNVTGQVKGALQNIQQQTDKALNDLTKDNPNLKVILDNARMSANGIVNVTQTVGEVVKEHVEVATGDLRKLGEQAQDEVSKTVKQLETKLQQVLSEKQKKTKTA